MFQCLCFPFLSFGEAIGVDHVIIRFGISLLIFFLLCLYVIGIWFFLPLHCNAVFVFTVSTLLCSCLKEKESRHVPWPLFCETLLVPFCFSNLSCLCILTSSSSSSSVGQTWTHPISRTVSVLGFQIGFSWLRIMVAEWNVCMGNANNWHHQPSKHSASTENRFGAGDIKNWDIFFIIHFSWDGYEQLQPVRSCILRAKQMNLPSSAPGVAVLVLWGLKEGLCLHHPQQLGSMTTPAPPKPQLFQLHIHFTLENNMFSPPA